MTDWRDDIHKIFTENDIQQVSYVPDAGHARVIDLCREDNRMNAVPMTTEMEGIGLACGAWLGGQKAVILMQSSGVGNCINALSLPAVCQFPLLMLVAMRGEFGEGQRWQMPMGHAVRPSLEAMGVVCYDVKHAADVRPVLENAITYAFQGHNRVALLLSQQLIGAKKFTK